MEIYALRIRNFYDLRARWDRRFFRLTSISLMSIGAGLPLAAGLSYGGKPVVLAAPGVTVSMLAALRAFYQWDQLWVMHRSTEITIHDAYTSWKREDDDFARSRDPAAGDLRVQAAVQFMDELLAVRKNESQAFFEMLLNAASIRG
ncbi:SLATT domain-containing protein [Actinomadura meridiana]|uniref:SLATT domain-containing protein n=1 Tax=Actinomadura meridiana TaxID=559626 RepID=UPI0031F0BF1B